MVLPYFYINFQETTYSYKRSHLTKITANLNHANNLGNISNGSKNEMKFVSKLKIKNSKCKISCYINQM